MPWPQGAWLPRAQPPRASVPPYRASGARLLVSGGGSMAAGAAEAAEAAAAVAEVGSARQFEELLRLKAKYAGRRDRPGDRRVAGPGLWIRGRPASAARPELSSRPNGGPGRAWAGPAPGMRGQQGSAAAPVNNGSASRRPVCGAS